MSYFDHVRCSSCKAMLDPESLGGRPGQGLTCPRCGAPLALTDLFGLKDSFAEEDGQEMSFDDLASVQAGPAARGPAGAAPPPSAPPPRGGGARPGAGSPRAAPGGRGAAPAASTALSRRAPPPEDDDDSEEPRAPRQIAGPSAAGPARPVPPPATPPAPAPKGSALDAMRKLKRK